MPEEKIPLCACEQGGCIALEKDSMLMIEGGRTLVLLRCGRVRCKLIEEHRGEESPTPA